MVTPEAKQPTRICPFGPKDKEPVESGLEDHVFVTTQLGVPNSPVSRSKSEGSAPSLGV